MSVTPSAVPSVVQPITAEAFAALMQPFGLAEHAHIAVAVSGGADSLALTLLTAAWAKARNIRVTTLTVDHRLRPEAATEAQSVATWMAAHGIAHHTLAWDEGAAVRHLTRSAQEAARDARYALLTNWCRANVCTHLLLAHHADDQLETFFIRLSRGSGLQGLASMDAQTYLRGVTLLRPLLEVGKAALVATCQAHGQSWIDDPSNVNPKYARSRFRHSRAVFEAEGLTADRLLSTIKHLQRARDAIGAAVKGLQNEACIWAATGVASLSAARLFAAPDEVSLRVLSDVLRGAGGQIYGPRFERLERLHAKLKHGDVATVTLHGCCVTRSGDAIAVMREPSAITETRALDRASTVLWDGRFECVVGEVAPGLSLRPYSAADKSFWKAQGESKVFDGIPATVRRSLPVIADPKGPIGMPHLNLWRSDSGALSENIAVRFIGAEGAKSLEI